MIPENIWYVKITIELQYLILFYINVICSANFF